MVACRLWSQSSPWEMKVKVMLMKDVGHANLQGPGAALIKGPLPLQVLQILQAAGR